MKKSIKQDATICHHTAIGTSQNGPVPVYLFHNDSTAFFQIFGGSNLVVIEQVSPDQLRELAHIMNYAADFIEDTPNGYYQLKAGGTEKEAGEIAKTAQVSESEYAKMRNSVIANKTDDDEKPVEKT